MTFFEIDKATLKSAQEKPRTSYEIEAKIYSCVTPRSKRVFMNDHLVKLVRCGLLSREVSITDGQAYYAITDLGEKLLRAGEKSRQKEQKEGGRCNLS